MNNNTVKRLTDIRFWSWSECHVYKVTLKATSDLLKKKALVRAQDLVWYSWNMCKLLFLLYLVKRKFSDSCFWNSSRYILNKFCEVEIYCTACIDHHVLLRCTMPRGPLISTKVNGFFCGIVPMVSGSCCVLLVNH